MTMLGDDVGPRGPKVHDPFIPVLLLALAMGSWLGFQTTQLVKERDAMRATFATQEKAVQDSKKLRDALDAVARETAQLAESGNENAKLIVDELRKRGITINPSAPPPAAPGSITPAAPTPATPAPTTSAPTGGK